jgi:hypothetical protein
VFRVLLLGLLLGFSFQLTGLAAAMGEPACAQDCPDDQSGGECAPNCHNCACCSLPRTVSPAPAVAIAPSDTHARVWTGCQAAPPSVEPADILHVPKHSLA